jgi:mannose-6-phosphate isomerase-like protein (cupin superfamily)
MDGEAEKRTCKLLAEADTSRQHACSLQGGTVMAKAVTKIRTRAKKSPARRSAARASPKASAKPASHRHKFMVHRHDPSQFKGDGLRDYAQYRDLGVKDATHGMAVAHVIKLVGKCDPKVVSKLHTHEADFQMIYVLKGSITSEFEGQGAHTMKTGDAWLQPKNIKHKVLDYSEDCELLEIVMPANFKTVELEK